MTISDLKVFFLVALVLLVSSSLSMSATFADSCSSGDSKLLQKVTASAGSWANLRNNPGSLRFESARLLKEGSTMLTSSSSTQKDSTLLLESSPKKFLVDYADFTYCKEKLSTTSASPIKFGPLSFASMEELSAWFSDFSQGSGKEGKALYAVCDKSCSPQYSLKIRQEAGQLKVEASAVCAHARDKDDDMYDLCTAINNGS